MMPSAVGPLHISADRPLWTEPSICVPKTEKNMNSKLLLYASSPRFISSVLFSDRRVVLPRAVQFGERLKSCNKFRDRSMSNLIVRSEKNLWIFRLKIFRPQFRKYRPFPSRVFRFVCMNCVALLFEPLQKQEASAARFTATWYRGLVEYQFHNGVERNRS